MLSTFLGTKIAKPSMLRSFAILKGKNFESILGNTTDVTEDQTIEARIRVDNKISYMNYWFKFPFHPLVIQHYPFVHQEMITHMKNLNDEQTHISLRANQNLQLSLYKNSKSLLELNQKIQEIEEKYRKKRAFITPKSEYDAITRGENYLLSNISNLVLAGNIDKPEAIRTMIISEVEKLDQIPKPFTAFLDKSTEYTLFVSSISAFEPNMMAAVLAGQVVNIYNQFEINNASLSLKGQLKRLAEEKNKEIKNLLTQYNSKISS